MDREIAIDGWGPPERFPEELSTMLDPSKELDPQVLYYPEKVQPGLLGKVALPFAGLFFLLALIVGLISTVILHGLLKITTVVHWELGAAIIVAMSYFTISLMLRYGWHLDRKEFFKTHLAHFFFCGLWLIACGR